MPIEVFAPAKVNLALHVTGRRADGYHLLDSFVVFAGVGDRIMASPGPLSLAVTGPLAAGVPAGTDNLVLRAARLMGAEAALRLDKHLPMASGIGGGSSDAAATLRALAALTGRALPDALGLGADLPVCLAAPGPQRVGGIGERLVSLPALPPVWLVLVNPGVGLATPAVFGALAARDNPPMDDPPQSGWDDAARLAAWLCRQRNDLDPPARALAPAIDAPLAAIGQTAGCLLARMSGSGATCFGIYATQGLARAAAAGLERPGWWVAAAPVLAPGGQLMRATT